MKTGPNQNLNRVLAPDTSEPKKRLRVRHRTAHFISSSLLELTENSDLPSWLMDNNEENDYKKICTKKSKLLSIKCKDSNSNIFGLESNILIKKITELTNLVTNTDRYTFIKDGKVYISNETMTSLRQQMEKLFEVKLTEVDVNGDIHTKACAGTQLLSFLISLRLCKEIKSKKIRLIELPTKENAIDDFDKLKKYVSKNHESISMFSKVGNVAVDYFTLTERIKASKRNRISAHDVTENVTAKLASTLTSHINSYYEQPFNIKNNIYISKDQSIDNKSVKNMIKTNFYVSQFPPSVLFDLISFLKKNCNFSFKDGKGYVLDPCGGWGGRAVACFAHSEIYYYTAVEPNQALTKSYDKMYQLYVSDKKSKKLFTFNQKLEDVEVEELKRENHEYDLAFTSPPYQDKEIYVTSGKEYADTSKWNYFLFKLLATSKVLRPGGLLVLNVSKNLIEAIREYKQSLNEFADLNWLSNCTAKSCVEKSTQGRVRQNKEVFCILRKEAGGHVRSSLIDLSPMTSVLSTNQISGIHYNSPTASKAQSGLNVKSRKIASYELLFSGLPTQLVPVSPTPIDKELMLSLVEYSNRPEFAEYNIYNIPDLEHSNDEDQMIVDELHAGSPEHDTDENKNDRFHQNPFIFSQNNNLPASLGLSLKRKYLDDDKFENEKSEVNTPKKKKPRRDPLEIDTVEGKKAKDKIVYDFNRKTKQQANDKIKLQLAATKASLAFMAEMISEDDNDRVGEHIDVYDDIRLEVSSGPLLIRFKKSLINSALSELSENEKNQTRISLK